MTRHAPAQPFQRSSDGRWIGRVRGPDGRTRHVTGTDREDVVQRMETLYRDLMTLSSPPTDGPLREHLERWFVDATRGRRNRPRTLRNNLAQARLHILPELGGRNVSTILPSDVQRMADRMTSQGYAVQTTRNVVNILSVVLETAAADRIILVNPCRHVRLPKREAPVLPSMSTDEMLAFLEASRGEPLWPAWALAFATAMRAGELCGLRWSDWDRERRTVTIDGQYRRVREGNRIRFVRQPGKTANARRTLHLPDLATEALTAQLAQATSAIVVFATAQGHPLDPTWLSHRWADTLKAHELPHVRLHSIRHTSAVSMSDASGGDIVAVSKVLGHSTIAVTVDMYGREADAARQRGASYMDRVTKVAGDK